MKGRCVAAVILAATVMPSMAQEQEEIILAHELRIAFYEAAPFKAAASMQRSVESLCAMHPEVEGWLCSGRPLLFLRGVYVTGSKKLSGFVCLGPSGGIKFYTSDMIEEDCIETSYDSDTAQHLIEIEDVKEADKDAQQSVQPDRHEDAAPG